MPKFVFSIQDRRGDSSRGYFTKYSSKIWVKVTYKIHERWGGVASCRLHNDRDRSVRTFLFARSRNYFNKLIKYLYVRL